MPLNIRRALGFSLIELMIVIAILGIVAALAIPAYNDYIVRAKVTNMINAVSTVKQAISEYRGYNGNFDDIDPTDAEGTFDVLGISDPSTLTDTIYEIKFASSGPNFAAIAVCGSVVGLGTKPDDVVNVYFTGESTDSGVSWNCAYTGNSKYVPSSCRTLYDPEIYGELDGVCDNE